ARDPRPAPVPLDAARARRGRGPLLLAAAAAVAAVVLGFTVIVGSGDDDRKDSADKSQAGAPAAAPRTPSASASPKAERPGSGTAENNPTAPDAAAPHVYSDADLPGQVTRLLGERPKDTHPLPRCVSAAVGPDVAGALAVDSGTYGGKSAYVVVLPGSSAARVRVTIVDASCSADASLTSGASEPATGPGVELSGSVLLDTEITRG
ncbi:hypothetical protein, partial [Streptomyces sp. SID3343]|uniref:hypothetical protein n=1 Tax=Streptomyces sp. SID3343 TaxID=2690260 RepID=UPI0013BED2B0